MPKHHELKIDPGLLAPIVRGEKTFEVRRDDRGFMPGDTVLLRETAVSAGLMAQGAPLEYTGKELLCRITYILRGPAYHIPAGFSVLAIKPLAKRDNKEEFHSPGAEAIAAERRRQVEEEGFTAEHDEQYDPDELAQLAAYYCCPGNAKPVSLFPHSWGDERWMKRQGFPIPTRRDLEKAGALCAAAIDRLDREE